MHPAKSSFEASGCARGRNGRIATLLNEGEDVKTKMRTLLAEADPSLAESIVVHVVFPGLAMAGGAPEYGGIDGDTLRQHLLDVGRRLLGRPRRQRPGKSQFEPLSPQSPRAMNAAGNTKAGSHEPEVDEFKLTSEGIARIDAFPPPPSSGS
jgi:hypothetical protein